MTTTRHAKAPGWGAAASIVLAGAWLATAPSQASEYACKVPRALVCADCASQIAINLLPGGGCRISFTAPNAAVAAPAATAPAQLEFKIEAPAVVVTRAPPHWNTPFRRTHPTIVAKASPGPRCFVFNGSRYCE